MSTIPHPTGSWQAGFLSVLPKVETHARIQFRRRPLEQREDAIQEAIASACVSYQRLAVRGCVHAASPSTLADFAVKHVRNLRHVGGHQDGARDAMSPVAQARRRFRTSSYDLFDREADEWRQMALEGQRTSIPDLAAFRIDFARWLRTLTHRNRKIIAAMVSGEGTTKIAGRFGVSPARVSQLRRLYEDRWRGFQGETVDQAS